MDCENCGRGPATKLVVRRHVGMLVLQQFRTVKAHLCRDCGRDFVKSWTGRTLVQGWWGVISFFFNWFVLMANLRAWLKASSLDHPMSSMSREDPTVGRAGA